MSDDPYKKVIDSVEGHPSNYPDVIITDSNTLKNFETEIGGDSGLYRGEPGYVGKFVDIPIWVDDRFDGSLMVTFGYKE